MIDFLYSGGRFKRILEFMDVVLGWTFLMVFPILFILLAILVIIALFLVNYEIAKAIVEIFNLNI